MKNFNVQIYVVSHSEEDIKKIKSDELYTPLFVGRNGKDNLGFCSDDIGDNISFKNSTLSELTGLYWMWKNSNFDVIGLCHYRRYFKNDEGVLLNKSNVFNYLNHYDILMPKKVRLIEGSLNKTYDGSHVIKKLEETRKLMKKMYPEYLCTYDQIMNQDSFSCYNMFVADKSVISKYCNWLFPFIKELEKNIDLKDEPRIIGVLTEYLFNVWVTHQKLKVKELDLYYVGNMLKLRMFFSNNQFFRKIYKKISKNDKIEDKIRKFFY